VGAVSGQVGVQVLAGQPEGLARRGLFLAQARLVSAGDALDELDVEGVAVAGDARQEGGQGGRGVVRRRAAARHPGRHENGPGQDGRPFEQTLGGGQVRGMLDALHEPVEGDLADDVAAGSALVVEVMRVPLAEDVVVGRRLTGWP